MKLNCPWCLILECNCKNVPSRDTDRQFSGTSLSINASRQTVDSLLQLVITKNLMSTTTNPLSVSSDPGCELGPAAASPYSAVDDSEWRSSCSAGCWKSAVALGFVCVPPDSWCGVDSACVDACSGCGGVEEQMSCGRLQGLCR